MAKKRATKKGPAVRAAAVGFKYIGRDGAHMGGVPAADLAPAYVAGLNSKQVDAILAATSLYKLADELDEGDQADQENEV